MDLQEILQQLNRERERIERTIAAIEELAAGELAPVRKRRGRKSMGVEERRQVSARMRKYWANRRKGKS